MTSHAKDEPRVSSTARIFFFSAAASIVVLSSSLLLQWLIYDDWLHRSGLRMVGTTIAAALTFLFVFRWLHALRQRQIRMLHRFETIARMNDRIRNALQQIACVTYVSHPGATEKVKQAVDVIDSVLREVLEDIGRFDENPKYLPQSGNRTAKGRPESSASMQFPMR